MIEDEFKDLINCFSQTSSGKPVNLEDICKHSLGFFEKLKEKLKEGSDEDKKEAIALMNEMYSTLLKETKTICEKTGLTEDQLMAFAENPNNFTPDQWRLIQSAKQKMMRQGNELTTLVKDVPHEGKYPPSQPKEKKPSSKPAKDKWMRS